MSVQSGLEEWLTTLDDEPDAARLALARTIAHALDTEKVSANLATEFRALLNEIEGLTSDDPDDDDEFARWAAMGDPAKA